MKIETLIKQSKFNKDINTIIDTIAPFIIDKKITKREIDKCNKALIDKFDIFKTEINEYTKEKYNIPFYYVYINDQYNLNRLVIYCNDRYIQTEEFGGEYIPSYTKEIYLDDDKTISSDVLMKNKNTSREYPTREQIEKDLIIYKDINSKINELETQKTALSFYYYLKELC